MKNEKNCFNCAHLNEEGCIKQSLNRVAIYMIPTPCDDWESKEAKQKKSIFITDDGREITEQEIMTFIDWLLDKNLDENKQTIMFESHIRKGMNIILSFKKKEDKK